MKRALKLVWKYTFGVLYRTAWSYAFGRVVRPNGRRMLVVVLSRVQPPQPPTRTLAEFLSGPPTSIRLKYEVVRGYASVRGLVEGVDRIYVKTIRMGGDECDPREELVTEFVRATDYGITWCWGWNEADADALRAIEAIS